MKLFRYHLIITLLIAIPILPQKKDLTLKQATIESYGLYPKPLSQPEWIPATDNFSYVEKNALLKGIYYK